MQYPTREATMKFCNLCEMIEFLQHIFVENPCEVNGNHYYIVSEHCQVILQDPCDSNRQQRKAIAFSMALSFLQRKVNHIRFHCSIEKYRPVQTISRGKAAYRRRELSKLAAFDFGSVD